MSAYYNENDPKAAQWLRELIKAGLIADGVVDERSIEDVLPSDLDGYTQCHFFAGIGGWSYSIRLAGWPDERPVWTGSCPCQPFSAAGKRTGTADERHLWPAWFHLIREKQPDVVFGEQVASKDGRSWLSTVQTDLEALGYLSAAFDLCAAGVGAPHIRQRLYFVAHSDGRDPSPQRQQRGREHGQLPQDGSSSSVEHTASEQVGIPGCPREPRSTGFWSECKWIECTDGKARPIEPGTFPLAHGIPGRVGLLRGYGNAIVPQVAEEVIRAYLETQSPSG